MAEKVYDKDIAAIFFDKWTEFARWSNDEKASCWAGYLEGFNTALQLVLATHEDTRETFYKSRKLSDEQIKRLMEIGNHG